jgi:hypothetical protein
VRGHDWVNMKQNAGPRAEQAICFLDLSGVPGEPIDYEPHLLRSLNGSANRVCDKVLRSQLARRELRG